MYLIYKRNISWQNLKHGLLIFLLPTLFVIGGCKKFLDQKPNTSDVIPTSLDELQTLLDNAKSVMNSSGTGAYAELMSDNIYVATATWQAFASSPALLLKSETQSYIWGNMPHDSYWRLSYGGPIYFSNIVLDQLPILGKGSEETDKYKALRGSALFYRSFAFHGLAQLYCKSYSTDNAKELGIVMPLTANVSKKYGRGTVQQTYDQIISDLKEAANLLPSTTAHKTRPSKTAAYAALARVYLSMMDYENAEHYADLALDQYSVLMNYNDLLPVGSPPIVSQNPEVIFHNYSQAFFLLIIAHKIDSTLYRSFDANDLRKEIFFQENGADPGTYVFRGSYNGSLFPYSVFDGLATDELYLIRAEATARSGNKDAALADLNALMEKRWSNNGTWTPIMAANTAEALAKIFEERRKELLFRGLRWADVRRFNAEGANITLRRDIPGVNAELPPNDLRSVMLIPFIELENNPNVQQNPR